MSKIKIDIPEGVDTSVFHLISMIKMMDDYLSVDKDKTYEGLFENLYNQLSTDEKEKCKAYYYELREDIKSASVHTISEFLDAL